MIDWVSIVRHSRRRFSSYVGNRPIRMKKRRRTPPPAPHIASSPTDDGHHLHYACCCSNVSLIYSNIMYLHKENTSYIANIINYHNVKMIL